MEEDKLSYTAEAISKTWAVSTKFNAERLRIAVAK
jgi:hypothetical protein